MLLARRKTKQGKKGRDVPLGARHTLTTLAVANPVYSEPDSNPVYSSLGTSTMELDTHRRRSMAEVPGGRAQPPAEIDAMTVYESMVIGRGSFWLVYRGKLQDGRTVAVKRVDHQQQLHEGAHDGLVVREAVFWAQIASHDNLVRFYGLMREPLQLVFEHMENGALVAYLQARTTDETRKREILLDCARALNYLHSLDIIHGDVAARNVLVAADHRCKLSDLRLAQFLRASGTLKARGSSHGGSAAQGSDSAGSAPVRWAAPETLQKKGKEAVKASDVWSFGVLGYEVWTEGKTTPYADIGDERVVATRVREGLRLACPPLCPRVVHETVMVPCWAAELYRRPVAQDLLDRLLDLVGRATAGQQSAGDVDEQMGFGPGYLEVNADE